MTRSDRTYGIQRTNDQAMALTTLVIREEWFRFRSTESSRTILQRQVRLPTVVGGVRDDAGKGLVQRKRAKSLLSAH